MMMTNKLIIAALVLTLTGCASNCTRACVFGIGPGNTLFDSHALAADRADPCQSGIARPELERGANYQIPEFCKAGPGRVKFIVTNPSGRTLGYLK